MLQEAGEALRGGSLGGTDRRSEAAGAGGRGNNPLSVPKEGRWETEDQEAEAVGVGLGGLLVLEVGVAEDSRSRSSARHRNCRLESLREGHHEDRLLGRLWGRHAGPVADNLSGRVAAGHNGPGWLAKSREQPWLVWIERRRDTAGQQKVAVVLRGGASGGPRRRAQMKGLLCGVKAALVLRAPLPCSGYKCQGGASAWGGWPARRLVRK